MHDVVLTDTWYSSSTENMPTLLQPKYSNKSCLTLFIK